MTPVWIVLGAVLTAVVTGTVTLLVAKRATSGTVATSDAATLWNSAEAMRAELLVTVTDLRDQVDKLTEKLDAANERLTSILTRLEQSNEAADKAKAVAAEARAEAARLRAAVEGVHQEVRDVHDDIKTGNALSAGALLDNQETRRIERIDSGKRTSAENEHVDKVGIQGRDQDRDEHE